MSRNDALRRDMSKTARKETSYCYSSSSELMKISLITLENDLKQKIPDRLMFPEILRLR